MRVYRCAWAGWPFLRDEEAICRGWYQAALSMHVELYTIAGCPYCAAAREDLDWRGVAYVEYDVERDREAYTRMVVLSGGNRTVPVLVELGKPPQIGWEGRGCFI